MVMKYRFGRNMKRNGWKKYVAVLMILAIILSTIGCSSKNGTSAPSTVKPTNGQSSEKTESIPKGNNEPVVVNGLEINDSFVKIGINELYVDEIGLEEISTDDVIVNCISVKAIDNLEIETTSINDEFVYLAYKNFVSVYGDDFNLKDFLKNVGIGAGCIIIYVTLSTAGGPVGTYFGAIINA